MNFLNASSSFVLAVISVLAVLLLAMRHGRRRRERVVRLLVGPVMAARLSSGVDPGKRRWRAGLFLAGCVLLALAAARPWWGQHLVHAPRRTRDLLVVLDCSKSMLARDVAPSRLQHAKWWLRQLAEACPGDRFGLIAFSGDAFLECPLTQDRNTLFQFLDEVGSDTIAVGGTNVAAALKAVQQAFKGAEGGHRAVILVSDGEELQGDTKAQLAEFKGAGVPLFVAGVGDPRQGAMIQLEDNSFLRDKNGKLVATHINEAGLRELSDVTGGIYVRTTAVNPNLDPVLRRVRQLVPEEHEDATVQRQIERYQVPLFLAVLCFLVRLCIGERRAVAAVSAVLLAVAVPLAMGADAPAAAKPASPAASTPAAGVAAEPFLPTILGPVKGGPGRAGAAPGRPAGPAAAGTPGAPAVGPGAAPPLDSPEAQAEAQRQAAQEAWARQQQERDAKRRADIAAVRKQLETAKPVDLARLHHNLGCLLQQQGQADEATKEYESALAQANVAAPVRARACHNLGVLGHLQAREQLSSDPDACLERLNGAEERYREAMLSDPGGPAAAVNQELLVRDRALAAEMKKIADQLRELQRQACQETGQALQQQRQANAADDVVERDTRTAQASTQTQKADGAVGRLCDAARQLGQDKAAEQVEKALDEVRAGREAQDQSRQTPRQEESRRQAGSAAEQHLADAFRMLGGQEQPPEGQPQDQDQQKQEQQADQKQQPGSAQQQAKGDQQKGEQQQAGDKQDGQESGDDVMKQLQAKDGKQQEGAAGKEGEEDEKFDPGQARAVLQQMQEQEQDLRQALKRRYLEQHRLQPVDKDW